MLTVLHRVTSWLPQTETWNHTQVTNLPGDRVHCHIACETEENRDQFPVDHLHCLTRQSPLARVVRRVARKTPLYPIMRNRFCVALARRIGADILHSHFGFYGWHDMPVARRAGVRHVVTFYGVDVNKFPRRYPVWRRRYGELFSQVDRVLCEGEYMAESLARLGCPEAKIRVQHLGVSLARIPYAPLAWTPGEPLKVLMAASFTQKKGIPDALDALGRIRHRVPLQITLIGDASDHPDNQAEKRRILDRIERHGFKQIRLTGYRPHREMLAAGREHHLFLSPSIESDSGDTEGGAPVSLIEMAAIGTLIVSTTHCDIPGVVKHGQTGLLAEPGDVDGIADALAWLLDHPDRWDAMRTAGRAHIEAEFDAARQGQRLADIYEELLAESS